MGEEGKVAAQAFFGTDETGVVSRVANRWIDPGHVTELREGTQDLRITRTQKLRRNLIECEVIGREVVAHVADVPCFDENATANLVLHI